MIFHVFVQYKVIFPSPNIKHDCILSNVVFVDIFEFETDHISWTMYAEIQEIANSAFFLPTISQMETLVRCRNTFGWTLHY